MRSSMLNFEIQTRKTNLIDYDVNGHLPITLLSATPLLRAFHRN